MRKRLLVPLAFVVAIGGLAVVAASGHEKVIVAHRGASGYLPEHTIAGYAMAYGMGADFIEPDLMLTKDGVPIALHDRTLESTTDVADVFPGRARDDGRYYAIDFTLEEIKRLAVLERFNRDTGVPTFPARFPSARDGALVLRVPTLVEVIELVQGLNASTGRSVGIYPETKSSVWHQEQGLDFERIVMGVLAEYGYTTKDDLVIVQSFESDSLLRLRELGSELFLVQLIGGGDAYAPMVTPEGMDQIAGYADGIGPSMTRIIDGDGNWVNDNFLVREAHARGLQVHPYTMRADVLPGYVGSFEELLELFLFEAGVDGVFTDHTDLAVRFLRERE
ncbi:MAG: glycerophosphodiester phosphodiesterase [Trueperaceae bacterium]|nr:glycerophosphodiester phosphodiesterase [Trueperaceae bacterium]